MRDAAAKFLVQFPDQPAAEQLARNEAVLVEKVAATGGGAGTAADGIEAVPIEEPKAADAAAAPATPPVPVTPVAGKS